VILPEGRLEVEQSLAFKTYDTEELADVCFFRPLGAIIARVLHDRAIGSKVGNDDRVFYARCFYSPKRGWILFGGNTPFYAIGVLSWMHRLDLYFVFIFVSADTLAVAKTPGRP
jgi:hypothetical protein